MSDLAIRVEGLGKKYKLGLTHDRTLRDLARRWTRRLFHAVSRCRTAGAPDTMGP